MQCEDKYVLRNPDKKGVNLCEHGVIKEQSMTLSNSAFGSTFCDLKAPGKKKKWFSLTSEF